MAGQSTQRDSFKDLTGLMKAKKPYTPNPPPAARSELAPAPQGNTYGSAVGNSRSSLATSFPAPESVANFLEQEDNESTVRAPKPTRFRDSTGHHLDALFEEQMKKYEPYDPPSPQSQLPVLIPQLGSPFQFRPRDLPTPADSHRPTPSPFLSETEPVVRLAKHVYESLCRDLDNLEEGKIVLEEKVLTLQRQLDDARHGEDDAGTQLGRLKYQNEANRTQKADMGRLLNEKEVKIKTQQLEIDELRAELSEVEAELKAIGGIAGERNYLRDTLSSVHDQHTRAFEEMTACKDQEIEQVKNTSQELQATLAQVTLERDAASRARLNASDQATREQQLTGMLNKLEKVNTNLRQQHLEEQLRGSQLEDEVETLKARTNQDDIDDLKQKLREKTSTCDRQRSQLKTVEHHLKVSEARVLSVANNGETLRGAAHLVVPQESSKLPRNVVSCSECYSNNLMCDANAKCRSCSERNTSCARWRCSLKQKLGNCPFAPCKLPHDSQGWLVLQQDARPQW